VVAALDHVDRVDLHVAQVLYGRARRLGPVAERCGLIEPLRVQSDAPSAGLAERCRLHGSRAETT
jgi:hypothetical protein